MYKALVVVKHDKGLKLDFACHVLIVIYKNTFVN